jgi:hypothetical protein
MKAWFGSISLLPTLALPINSLVCFGTVPGVVSYRFLFGMWFDTATVLELVGYYTAGWVL